MNKEFKKNEPINDKIKDRESWVKVSIAIILFALVAYKIAVSELNFDFSKFQFSDLLSLILAIFSIALSVAFYFKATDTSNKFYNNTFKFTKEISEILGRIEAGFGERLRHLDEGYSGLKDKFDGGSYLNQSENIEDSKKELEKEKMKIEKEVKEKDEILASLMKKARLDEAQQIEVTKKLKLKETEIDKLNNELEFLKRRIYNAEKSLNNDLQEIPNSIKEIIKEYLIRTDLNINTIVKGSQEFLQRHLKIEGLPKSVRNKLFFYEIISSEGVFTELGIRLLKHVARTS